MSCTIPGANVKPLLRLLQVLSKFSDHAAITFLEDKLFVFGLNSAKTVYTAVSLNRTFFDLYRYVPHQGSYRITLKPLVNIFKTNTENIVECKIHPVSFQNGDERLVITMTCRYGVIKTHKLNFEQCETVQADFSSAACPNRWVIHPKVINEYLLHFPQKARTITFASDSQWFKLKNFEDSHAANDSGAVIRTLDTEIYIALDEFDSYNVTINSDLSFELKDVKAVIAFAEALEVPIVASFDPVAGVMGISCTPHLHHCSAEFVIASTRDPLNADVREPTHTAAAFEAQNDPRSNENTQANASKPTSRATSHTGPSMSNVSRNTFSNLHRPAVVQQQTSTRPSTQSHGVDNGGTDVNTYANMMDLDGQDEDDANDVMMPSQVTLRPFLDENEDEQSRVLVPQSQNIPPAVMYDNNDYSSLMQTGLCAPSGKNSVQGSMSLVSSTPPTNRSLISSRATVRK